MSDNFLGQSIQGLIDQTASRYFYGLRRTDDGELYLAKIDQLKAGESITINNPGDPEENYQEFQQGEDFFEGRDIKHQKVYDNLNFEQFRWDNRDLLYYVDDEGNLVVRINENYDYPTGI